MKIPINMQEAPTADSGILKMLNHSLFVIIYRVHKSRF